MTKAGVETPLHSFQGNGQGLGDGAYSFSGLLAVGGMLYGPTQTGGGSSLCPGGCGTVFSLTTLGVETVLHSFRGGNDGAVPTGLLAAGGLLYGTTAGGGAHGMGTVFELTP